MNRGHSWIYLALALSAAGLCLLSWELVQRRHWSIAIRELEEALREFKANVGCVPDDNHWRLELAAGARKPEGSFELVTWMDTANSVETAEWTLVTNKEEWRSQGSSAYSFQVSIVRRRTGLFLRPLVHVRWGPRLGDSLLNALLPRLRARDLDVVVHGPGE